jgi:8-oxo-dGTP pyrophosphatase MutT (NUDIX family)
MHNKNAQNSQNSQNSQNRQNNQNNQKMRKIKEKVSYGIILCKQKNLCNKNKLEILLIRKRYTYHFSEFVMGRYDDHDDKEIRYLFNNMTAQEKIDIIKSNYNLLWYRLWVTFPINSDDNFLIDKITKKIEVNAYCDKIITQFNKDSPLIVNRNLIEQKEKTLGLESYLRIENIKKVLRKNNNTNMEQNIISENLMSMYLSGKEKYERFIKNIGRATNLLNNTLNVELLWEAPKGHKQNFEKPMDAALREFHEETFIHVNTIKLLPNAGQIVHVLEDKDNLFCTSKYKYKYKTIYYLAVSNELDDHKYIFNTSSIQEVDDVRWMNLRSIEFYNMDSVVKKNIINLFDSTYKMLRKINSNF